MPVFSVEATSPKSILANPIGVNSMADNVQGFNHLDEILLHLGYQFRQDAIRKMMMENQMKIAGMRASRVLGANAQGKTLQELRAGLNQMEKDKSDFIRNHIEKNALTGEYTVTPAQVEAEWMRENGPDYQAYQSALNTYITSKNPNLKLPSMNKGGALPSNFDPVNQNLSSSMMFGNGM